MKVDDRQDCSVFRINSMLRKSLGAGLILLGLGLLFGAISIPFTHESFTIKYKFGLERRLLRTGQVLGAAAGMLMLFQFVLSSRLKLLDRIFAINRLYNLHRMGGMTLAVLALLHGILVLLAQGMNILDPTLKNWPQYAGLILLGMLGGLVVASRWRKKLGLPYHVWRFFHTKTTHLAVAILMLHILYGCDTFQYPPARTWLFISIGIYALLLAWVKVAWQFTPRRFKVTHVAPTGIDARAVTLHAEDNRPFPFAPGQFVFIRFKSAAIPAEAHPFTISSPPGPRPVLELTIRACGDWTDKIRLLKPGDRARINGPYGLFGNIDLGKAPGIIMIAGGIGITPMLSRLGAMSEKEDPRPMTLVWSNRTRAHRIHFERIDAIDNKLKNLRIYHILTREHGQGVPKQRLDTAGLGKMLSGCSRQSKVLVCGPPTMMISVRKSLLRLGFHRRSILMERFDL